MRATGVIFSSPDASVVVVLFHPTIHSSTGRVTKNIAKGTTDPRVEFILPKQLLKVIS